mgnify:CR=1 FL=1
MINYAVAKGAAKTYEEANLTILGKYLYYSKERGKNCNAHLGRKLHFPKIHLNYFNEII